MSEPVHRVRFEYCISLVFLTWRRETDPVEVTPGWRATVASLPYCLITLILGWWGIPWGFFLTPVVLWNNLSGGRVEDTPQAQG